MENTAVDEYHQLDLLREFISHYHATKESIYENTKFEKEYLLLTSKLCELGNYFIVKSAPRYIFQIYQNDICVRDLVFRSNDTSIPYDKIGFSELENGNYGLLMSWWFGFTLTKQEAYNLYNIIKLKQMKYPYTVSKIENNSYSIIDSAGNGMAFFNTYEEANNFNTNSLTYIDSVDEINIDNISNQEIDVEEFLNS